MSSEDPSGELFLQGWCGGTGPIPFSDLTFPLTLGKPLKQRFMGLLKSQQDASSPPKPDGMPVMTTRGRAELPPVKGLTQRGITNKKCLWPVSIYCIYFTGAPSTLALNATLALLQNHPSGFPRMVALLGTAISTAGSFGQKMTSARGSCCLPPYPALTSGTVLAFKQCNRALRLVIWSLLSCFNTQRLCLHP